MIARLCTLLVIIAVSPIASAHFSIDKSRLFFDKNNRFQTLYLRNNSSSPVSFSLRVNHVDMTEDGRVYLVDDESVASRSAKKLIRYSPRRGSILPGGSQVVRFSVRKPAGLGAGEYRSQIRIEGGIVGDTTMLSSRLAYNLPIIVRHGNTIASVSIENVKMGRDEKGNPLLSLILFRQGGRSVYGDVTVLDSANQEVAVNKGLAIYPPLQNRMVAIPLTESLSGQYRIQFVEPSFYGGSINISKDVILR